MESRLIGPGSTREADGRLRARRHRSTSTSTRRRSTTRRTRRRDLVLQGRAVASGRASVWRGVIRVAEGAQKTDAYQENRNLVLSPRAHADSIPGLEIKANDVRCTHGATIGRVDPEELYYLMSRGLDRAAAERLIVEGFFVDAFAADQLRRAAASRSSGRCSRSCRDEPSRRPHAGSTSQRIRADFPILRARDQRPADRLPRLGEQRPEAAPGARRDVELLRDLVRERAPRRLHARRRRRPRRSRAPARRCARC